MLNEFVERYTSQGEFPVVKRVSFFGKQTCLQDGLSSCMPHFHEFNPVPLQPFLDVEHDRTDNLPAKAAQLSDHHARNAARWVHLDN